MTKSVLGMIEQFAGEVEGVVGLDTRQKVMSGAADLTPNTAPADVARWMKGAVDRLDSLAPQDACKKIMEKCGSNCSQVNYTAIKRGKARREKFADEEAFLAAELSKPQKGTRMERKGNILFQIYTPGAYTRPMRCYCGLMHGLPPDVQVSATYCHCSKGFVRAYWSEVLGRPVEVELQGTALTGASECRFEITL